MELNSNIKFADIIEYERNRSAKNRYASNSYCIYWLDNDDSPETTDIVFIGEYPEITEDDEEIFPKEVLKRGWWLCYRDELIQDVVDNSIYQKPSVTNDEINHAIKYYNAIDTFWDFQFPEKNTGEI
jgi:hypothetical protein